MAGLDIAMIFALIGAIVGRVRRGHRRPRHADPDHDLHDGRLRPVLGAADPVRSWACGLNRARPAGPPAGALLGPVGEGGPRAVSGGRARAQPRSRATRAPGRRRSPHGEVPLVAVSSPSRRSSRCSAAALAGPAQAQVTKLQVRRLRADDAGGRARRSRWPPSWAGSRQEGIDVELVPMPGSTDCVKTVAVREVDCSLPSVEPLAIGPPAGHQGQDLLHGVPGQHLRDRRAAGQPDQGVHRPEGQAHRRDLDGLGRRARGPGARPRAAGLNPDTDVTIVVAGEGAQTAAMVRSGQVDALSQFDTQYAMVENAGVKLRLLDTRAIDRFPLERLPRARGHAAGPPQGGGGARAELREGRRCSPSPTPRPRSGCCGRSSRDEAHRQGRGDGAPRRRQGAPGAGPETGGSRRPASSGGARTRRRTTAPTPTSC